MAKKAKSNGNDGIDEIGAMFNRYLTSSVGYNPGELVAQRADALRCYYTEIAGNQNLPEQEIQRVGVNRSTAVSSDVRDTIEWLIPQLAGPFVSDPDGIIDVEPVEPGDEEQAEQQKDYATYVFFKENKGYLQLQTCLRDAALLKNGYFKIYWAEEERIQTRNLNDVPDEKFLELTQNESNEIINHQYTEEDISDEMGVPTSFKLHSFTLKTKYIKKYIKIDVPAPENIFVTSKQWSIDLRDCEFIAERFFATQSELIQMGISEEKVKALPSNINRVMNPEQYARYNYAEEQTGWMTLPDIGNEAMRNIECFEGYMMYDSDGDNIPECHKIIYSNFKVLDDEIVDRNPYFANTLLLLPHKHLGLSIYDLAQQTEQIKTICLRQTLDNLYVNNNPIVAYDENKIINTDNVVDRQPGQTIPVSGLPQEAIFQLQTTSMIDEPLRMIDYCDKKLAASTGVTQLTTGLDPDVLNNNKGDQSTLRLMDSAQQRLAFMARNVSETLCDVFEYIIELGIKYESKEKLLRLRNKYTPVDPASWRMPMDVTIKVGLGYDDKTKQIIALNAISQDMQILQQSGAFGVLFNHNNVYQLLKDKAKAYGQKYPEKYYLDPNSEEAQQFAKQQSQAQAAQQDAQNFQIKAIQLQAQIDQQNILLKQREQQLQAQKDAFDRFIKQNEMELKRLDAARQMHDSIEKNAISKTDLELKYQQNIPGALV
jgi:hypothetical protein